MAQYIGYYFDDDNKYKKFGISAEDLERVHPEMARIMANWNMLYSYLSTPVRGVEHAIRFRLRQIVFKHGYQAAHDSVVTTYRYICYHGTTDAEALQFPKYLHCPIETYNTAIPECVRLLDYNENLPQYRAMAQYIAAPDVAEYMDATHLIVCGANNSAITQDAQRYRMPFKPNKPYLLRSEDEIGDLVRRYELRKLGVFATLVLRQYFAPICAPHIVRAIVGYLG
jgi:hypothetical protein